MTELESKLFHSVSTRGAPLTSEQRRAENIRRLQQQKRGKHAPVSLLDFAENGSTEAPQSNPAPGEFINEDISRL